MRVTWAQEASENLLEIEEFIARDSLDRAVRFVDGLIDHAEAILTDNPRSGREKGDRFIFYPLADKLLLAPHNLR